ncbi:hypothetical protein PSP6_340030 [Paraburkholderia tropica]|nr:hypothetical protein PSP6_340030 [Paraburkholderia tropica]
MTHEAGTKRIEQIKQQGPLKKGGMPCSRHTSQALFTIGPVFTQRASARQRFHAAHEARRGVKESFDHGFVEHLALADCVVDRGARLRHEEAAQYRQRPRRCGQGFQGRHARR